MANGNGRTWWERAIAGAVPALVVAFVLGALSLGRSDAAQETRIGSVESRQDRDGASTAMMLSRLEEEIRIEREARQRDMSELRAYLVEILKEVRK